MAHTLQPARLEEKAAHSSLAATFSRAMQSRLVHLWVVGFYSLFSVVMTWPLVLRMRDSVVDQIGDNIYFVFLIRWYQKAWFELGISPFFHPQLNYPQGWNLASTDTSLATTLFGLPASLIFGPTFGYNIALLVTFVFSGWAMFYWVRRLTASASAGLVAGMIYAFLPYRMARFLIGHMNLSGTQWFPLYFMALYDLLRQPDWNIRRIASWKPVLLAALMLGLIGFTSMYYLYMVLLISAVFAPAFLWFSSRTQFRSRIFWRALAGKLIALSLASLPLVYLSISPFLGLDSQGGLASRDLYYASMYSASPTDFILPSPDHFLWGNWINDHFDRSLWIEGSMYIGAVTLVLAAVAWRWRKHSGHAALFPAAVLTILAAFILALGIHLYWNNEMVVLQVPAFLQGLLNRDSTPVPLPANLLFRYLPFFDRMRSIMRFGFFVLLFSTVLAGFGAAWLLNKAQPRRALPLLIVLLGLVFIDFYPGPYSQFSRVDARPVDYWLAQQQGQGAVAQFPFFHQEDQEQVYYTLVHQKPFIGGFFSANQPEQYVRIHPQLEPFPTVEGIALLRELGVRWVIFSAREYPDFPAVRGKAETLGLRWLQTLDGQAVFVLEE